jgi:RHS repeat-associated protein
LQQGIEFIELLAGQIIGASHVCESFRDHRIKFTSRSILNHSLEKKKPDFPPLQVTGVASREPDGASRWVLVYDAWNHGEPGGVSPRFRCMLEHAYSVLGSSAYAMQNLYQGGRLSAESGLYYFRNRDYSATLGRWVSLDPIRFSAGDVNLYRYVGNNAGNKLDPSGLIAPFIVLGGIAIGWMIFDTPTVQAPSRSGEIIGRIDHVGNLISNLECIAKCTEDNDPIDYLMQKAVLLFLGGPIPKSVVIKLAELVGDHEYARLVKISLKNGTSFTTLPSIISSKQRLGAKSYMRSLGAIFSPIAIAYGATMAAIECHCALYCSRKANYDPNDGNIARILIDRSFRKQNTNSKCNREDESGYWGTGGQWIQVVIPEDPLPKTELSWDGSEFVERAIIYKPPEKAPIDPFD